MMLPSRLWFWDLLVQYASIGYESGCHRLQHALHGLSIVGGSATLRCFRFLHSACRLRRTLHRQCPDRGMVVAMEADAAFQQVVNINDANLIKDTVMINSCIEQTAGSRA